MASADIVTSPNLGLVPAHTSSPPSPDTTTTHNTHTLQLTTTPSDLSQTDSIMTIESKRSDASQMHANEHSSVTTESSSFLTDSESETEPSHEKHYGHRFEKAVRVMGKEAASILDDPSTVYDTVPMSRSHSRHHRKSSIMASVAAASSLLTCRTSSASASTDGAGYSSESRRGSDASVHSGAPGTPMQTPSSSDASKLRTKRSNLAHQTRSSGTMRPVSSSSSVPELQHVSLNKLQRNPSQPHLPHSPIARLGSGRPASPAGSPKVSVTGENMIAITQHLTGLTEEEKLAQKLATTHHEDNELRDECLTLRARVAVLEETVKRLDQAGKRSLALIESATRNRKELIDIIETGDKGAVVAELLWSCQEKNRQMFALQRELDAVKESLRETKVESEARRVALLSISNMSTSQFPFCAQCLAAACQKCTHTQAHRRSSVDTTPGVVRRIFSASRK
eukprot:comp4771_c0_seq1/m.906 comp4771_c0_seq1/g.906  ORF comp4771_c0_seq1/g.906 comp4771_c0_seq1/m.906 type:complete len:453 (-) comp4771_c0_seq1:312-1670(-)